MAASATITDSPDEVTTTENPQAIDRETSMEEDACDEDRPQQARQGPKWLMYDSLGNQLMYERLMQGHLPG